MTKKKKERGMGHCKLVVGEDGARRTNTSNRILRQIDSKWASGRAEVRKAEMMFHRLFIHGLP